MYEGWLKEPWESNKEKAMGKSPLHPAWNGPDYHLTKICVYPYGTLGAS